ncbi:MAG: hydroxymethylglutaryl-CoA reductase, partial [Bacteroidota bacterium]
FFESISSQQEFLSWISEHQKGIEYAAESTTKHGKLIEIEPYVLNKYVILDFGYETGNAAGQNMVSKATQQACEFIRQETGVDYILDSNFSSDKKGSGITRLKGRGHYVSAQAFLPHRIIEKVLGTTAESLNRIQEFGPYASNAAGNQGVQLHLSNALAAIYLATGQDVACVAENAVGFTQTKLTKDGMEFLLTMPSISVGTVGGGTRLPQQQKCLKLLGCDTGKQSAKKLAEIICASALCLEISLMAAIVSEKWVGAHMKYGRNKS